MQSLTNKAEFLLCFSQMFIGHWDSFFCQAGFTYYTHLKKIFISLLICMNCLYILKMNLFLETSITERIEKVYFFCMVRELSYEILPLS